MRYVIAGYVVILTLLFLYSVSSSGGDAA